MNKIRGIVFEIFFAIWTIICAVFGLPIGINQKYAIKLAKLWARGGLFLIKLFCNIGVSVDKLGLEKLAKSSGLILSKHQSTWDTIYFLSKLPKVSYVIKADLLKIPFYGWYLKKMGMIPVNRSGSLSELKKMNREIANKIKNGYNVILFPQGTRTKGDEFIKYKFGSLEIFNEIEGNVYPVALNSGYFWPKGLFNLKKSGNISIKICDPIFINKHILSANKISLKKTIEKIIEIESRNFII